MNARTLQQAFYHIRTEMGLSASTYTHSDEFPIYGTGQGSGNLPIWCFLSSRLYASYNARAHAATYSNPDYTNQVSLSMIGFVDNSNGQVNMFEAKDTLELLSQFHLKARHNATVWAKLIGSDGWCVRIAELFISSVLESFNSRRAGVSELSEGVSQNRSHRPDDLSDTNTGIFIAPPPRTQNARALQGTRGNATNPDPTIIQEK
jgi:hypothetical protein